MHTEQHLLMIAIGPVQEFIASARRSRDLWFGSWLLSELSKAAAFHVAQNHGINSLIFPAPVNIEELKEASGFDAPNKIVAVIEASSEDTEKLGQEIEGVTKDRLLALAKEAYEQRVTGAINTSKALAQVEDLIEYFWAHTPIQPSGYAAARELLEAIMSARKTTRTFQQTDKWRASDPKSSLDGQRESVIPECAYPRIGLPKPERLKKLRKLRLEYGVRNGERLCGVGLLKRHGARDKEQRVFSTSHVAVQPLIARLKTAHKPALSRYVETLKGLLDESYEGKANHRELLGNVPTKHPIFGTYDGHILFEERLSDLFPDEDKERLKKARQALKQFLNSVEKGVCPLPYYALLLADGDRMGAAISAQTDEDQHRRLSDALSNFASEARKTVARHNGSLVYAGGDDVLAFVPIHTALDCAHDVMISFRCNLKDFKFEAATGGHTQSPTLSVGLAVTHHLEPLSDTLRLARLAEKEAKKVPGKNALAIALSKRSGVDRIVAGKWGALDTRMRFFVDLHALDAIPDGAAYELRDLAIRLSVSERDADDFTRNSLLRAMRVEAVRILGRKQPKGDVEGLTDSNQRGLEELILTPQEFAASCPETKSSPLEHKKDESNHPTVDVGQLADELIIARIFADANTLASATDAQKESN